MMRREHDRFPERPFVAFSITHKHEDTTTRALQSSSQCRARAHREPMSERARGEINSTQSAFRVNAEQAVVGAIRIEGCITHPALEIERRVEGERGVSFGEDEAVA